MAKLTANTDPALKSFLTYYSQYMKYVLKVHHEIGIYNMKVRSALYTTWSKDYQTLGQESLACNWLDVLDAMTCSAYLNRKATEPNHRDRSYWWPDKLLAIYKGPPKLCAATGDDLIGAPWHLHLRYHSELVSNDDDKPLVRARVKKAYYDNHNTPNLTPEFLLDIMVHCRYCTTSETWLAIPMIHQLLAKIAEEKAKETADRLAREAQDEADRQAILNDPNADPMTKMIVSLTLNEDK